MLRPQMDMRAYLREYADEDDGGRASAAMKTLHRNLARLLLDHVQSYIHHGEGS